MHGRRTGKTSGMTLSIKEPGQKVRRAPTEPYRRPYLSKARRQLEKKKTIGKMEERRRRRVALENLAKEMLRYLDNSDDVKVDITELQECLEVPVQIGIFIQQVAQLARSENGQKILKYVGKKKKSYVLPARPDGRRSGKAQSTWDEGVKTCVGKYKS